LNQAFPVKQEVGSNSFDCSHLKNENKRGGGVKAQENKKYFYQEKEQKYN
jgi:hypothetical protein